MPTDNRIDEQELYREIEEGLQRFASLFATAPDNRGDLQDVAMDVFTLLRRHRTVEHPEFHLTGLVDKVLGRDTPQHKAWLLEEEEYYGQVNEDLIYTLVMTGKYTIEKKDWGLASVDSFLTLHEQVADELYLEYIPLHFDHASRTFLLHPAFINDADPQALAEYRQQFAQRFEEAYVSDDGISENYELVPSPKLPYRVAGSDYADSEICSMVGIPVGDEYTDDWGWIENRKRIFYCNLGSYCDSYRLPRLPVAFDRDGTPRFQASQKEIGDFCMLFRKRYKIEEEKAAIEDELEQEMDEELRLDPEADPEDIRDRYYHMTMNAHAKLDWFQQPEWDKENVRYTFPSKVDSYPDEGIVEFNDNLHDMHNAVTAKKKELRELPPPVTQAKLPVSTLQLN